MAGAENVKRDLAEILSKLETRSTEGYGALCFRAKALGKTKDSIHLAVETGIISVPFTEIESIRPIAGLGELEVMVDVRNGDRITHLRRVPDAILSPIPPCTLPDSPALEMRMMGTSIDRGIDTTTASGGVADATDDHRYYGGRD